MNRKYTCCSFPPDYLVVSSNGDASVTFSATEAGDRVGTHSGTVELDREQVANLISLLERWLAGHDGVNAKWMDV